LVFTALFDQFERFLFFAFRIKKFLYLKVNLLKPVQGKKKSSILEPNLNYFFLSTHYGEKFKNKKKISKNRIFDVVE
jgi:hypothetical protein